jgi:hypothetical protein
MVHELVPWFHVTCEGVVSQRNGVINGCRKKIGGYPLHIVQQNPMNIKKKKEKEKARRSSSSCEMNGLPAEKR